MRGFLLNSICGSLLLLGSCLAEVPPEKASVPVASESQPASPGTAAVPATNCDDKTKTVKSVMIDGREAIEYSIKDGGQETSVYAFKDVHVICFRQQPMPKGIAAALGDSITPIDADWSRNFLENRSCLVVSASDDAWKTQTKQLNKLRDEGVVWAFGQVVKFDQDPKSGVSVILDRVGFDLLSEHGMEGLLASSEELGFSITKSDAPANTRPRVPKYLAIPNSTLSALELVALLDHSEQVEKVEPTYVSPLQLR